MLLLSQEGKACQKEKKKVFFPFGLPFLPGTQRRQLEVLQPSYDHEAPHWRMRATELRMVMQQDTAVSQKESSCPGPELATSGFM